MDEVQLEPIREAVDRLGAVRRPATLSPSEVAGASDGRARRLRTLLMVMVSVFLAFVVVQALFAGANSTAGPSVIEGDRTGSTQPELPVDRSDARGLVVVPDVGPTPYAGPVSVGVEVMTPPPLLPRVGSAMIANDEGIFVWGGHSELDGGFLAYNDGAFYNFEARTWERLPPSPIVTNGGTRPPAAAWSGSEAIVYHNRQGAAWDPASNTWRRLTSAPGDVLGLYPLEGRGLYAVTNDVQGFYRARDDFWVPVAETDVGLGGATLEGVGRRAIAWRPGAQSIYIVVAGDEIELWKEPGGEQVQLDRPHGADHVAAAWIGDEIVIATDTGLLLRYDIEARQWSETPIPLVFEGRAPFNIVGTGSGTGADPGTGPAPGSIVVDEVAQLVGGPAMWQVVPPPVPGSSSAGSVLVDGEVWRLGTSVDTDGETWAFTVVRRHRIVREPALMLGPIRLRVDEDVLLRMLTVPVADTTGDTAADRHLRAELLVLPRIGVPGGVCEVTYGTAGQRPPVAWMNPPNSPATLAVDFGQAGSVLIECPSEASATNLGGDLSAGP